MFEVGKGCNENSGSARTSSHESFVVRLHKAQGRLGSDGLCSRCDGKEAAASAGSMLASLHACKQERFGMAGVLTIERFVLAAATQQADECHPAPASPAQAHDHLRCISSKSD
eukprot:1780832-Pleurochrysis_carterae.AAC.1